MRALVAGHVEHAEHFAVVVEDRRRRAGEEVVRADVVLAAVHQRRRLVEQRGADRIRALALLGPVDAGRERDLLRLLHEAVVADRLQDRAVGVGQHDHAVRADDLLVEQLHHRRRLVAQPAVLLARLAQPCRRDRRKIGRARRLDAERRAARVRALDRLDVARRQRGLGLQREGVGGRAAAGRGCGGFHAGPSARARF
jgi:hypothetical protein